MCICTRIACVCAGYLLSIQWHHHFLIKLKTICSGLAFVNEKNLKGRNEVGGIISWKIMAVGQDYVISPQAPTCRLHPTQQLCNLSVSYYFTVMVTRGGSLSDFPSSISHFSPPPSALPNILWLQSNRSLLALLLLYSPDS